MKKCLVIFSLLSVGFFMSFTFNKRQEGYENLKVLPQSTNKHQMDSIMKHFSWSLGVNCDFCHVRIENEMHDWNFASDTNANKRTAREMMRMTDAVNKQYFAESQDSALQVGQAITCNSCHHGQRHPEPFPVKPVRP